MTEANDERVLLEKFRAGNEAACRWLHDQYYRAICYFSAGIVGDIDQAADIASDCFAKLWSQRTDMESEVHIKAFLYTTARNASFNHLKALKVRSGAQDDLRNAAMSLSEQDHFLAKMIKAQLLQHIYTEVEKLPPKLQTIFKLIYIEGRTPKEVAAQLDIPEQSVRNAKGKALKQLRHILTKRKVMVSLALFFYILLH